MTNILRRLAVLSITLLLTACALDPRVVDHAFGFNANADSADVYILDYQYGDSRVSMAKNPDEFRAEGKSLQAANVNGPMTRGDFLYVKWRVKDTGRIYEDRVDLRSRLPFDLTNQIVYFIVKGPQLYVYLISRERRPADESPVGPRVYSAQKTTTIYPDR